MKKYFIPILATVLLTAGCSEPQPRRPVSVSTGSFIKESIERNKQLLQEEEALIQNLLAKDSLRNFQRTPNGYWYHLTVQDSTTNYYPGVAVGYQANGSYNGAAMGYQANG